MKKLNWMKPHLLVQQLTCAGLLLGVAGQAQAVYESVGTYDKTECVKDTTTNLIWEGKTARGTRAGSKKYRNYDSNYGTAVEVALIDNAIGYVKAINAMNLCGFNDWRMPTKDELLTLIKQDSSPTLDTTWFPNTLISHFWSSSPNTSYAGNAWFVSFNNGQAYSYGYRSIGFGVRLVRVAN